MTYTRILLAGSYRDGPGAETLPVGRRGRPQFRYDRFVELVARLRASRRVSTVLIEHRPDFEPGGLAAAESIRAALEGLAAAGKHLIYFCEDCDTVALYLASACRTRVLHPAGELRVLGFSRRFFFPRKWFERLGGRAVVIRRGEYKSAADGLRTDSLDPPNRRQHYEYLDRAYRRFRETVAAALSKETSDLDVLASGHVLPAEQAVEHGWMTETATLCELERRLEDEKQKCRTPRLKGRFGRRGPRIAVLYLHGAICDGESRRHPLLGNCVGDRTVSLDVRRLADDRKTAGVVLRVSSPGGAVLASESIRTELAYLRGKKPLVVSMGDVAGSGGYWIACEAERIFAEPDTLTGSVGVLTVAFDLTAGLKRHGIATDTVETAPHAELASPFRRLSRDDYRILDERVQRVYEDFLTRVAEARGMSPDAVEQIAAGRLWSGEAAREVGLVDELGGLPAAVSWLAERLGAKRVRQRHYPEVKPSLAQRLLAKNVPIGGAGAEPPTAGEAAAALRGAAAPGGVAAAPHGTLLAVVPELLLDASGFGGRRPGGHYFGGFPTVGGGPIA